MSVACTQSSSAGILGGIRSAGGETAAGFGQRTVDTPMNGADGLQRAFAIVLAAKGEREHRADGVMQPRERGARAAAERAVFGDASGNQGMGKLQQDRPHPAEEHEPLRVDARRDRRMEPVSACREPGAERIGRLRLDRAMTAADFPEMMRASGIGKMRGGIAAQQREAIFLLQVVAVILERAGLLEVPLFREELDDFAVDA